MSIYGDLTDDSDSELSELDIGPLGLELENSDYSGEQNFLKDDVNLEDELDDTAWVINNNDLSFNFDTSNVKFTKHTKLTNKQIIQNNKNSDIFQFIPTITSSTHKYIKLNNKWMNSFKFIVDLYFINGDLAYTAEIITITDVEENYEKTNEETIDDTIDDTMEDTIVFDL